MARILPMLLMLMIVLGAFYPAIEVTAGEKERGTLQTLLTAPISPLEIVTGKFLSVFCVAAVTGACGILFRGERLFWWQAVGLGGTIAAVGLIVTG